jgi:hypothetical protein
LRELGWRRDDGGVPQEWDLYGMPATDLLSNLADRSAVLDPMRRIRVSPLGAALAQAALT